MEETTLIYNYIKKIDTKTNYNVQLYCITNKENYRVISPQVGMLNVTKVCDERGLLKASSRWV